MVRDGVQIQIGSELLKALLPLPFLLNSITIALVIFTRASKLTLSNLTYHIAANSLLARQQVKRLRPLPDLSEIQLFNPILSVNFRTTRDKMPFTIITGSFHVVGYSPDGDSVRFGADKPDLFTALEGPTPRLNARGHVQLRIEAVDTLETHYNASSGAGELRQPALFAEKATNLLLDFLGIKNVEWNASHKQVVSADDGTRGFILTRAVEKNRRPVAFVFTGDAPGPDGSDFRLTPEFLERSYNFHVLEEGLAYATYYWGLFFDLRDKMTAAVTSARSKKLGLYAKDTTTTAFTVRTIADLTDNLVLMPKLFRRLSEYFASTGSVVGFKKTLEKSREPVLEIKTANFTHFDTFIEQAEGSSTLRLKVNPEALVFDAMPTRMGNAFTALVEGLVGH